MILLLVENAKTELLVVNSFFSHKKRGIKPSLMDKRFIAEKIMTLLVSLIG